MTLQAMSPSDAAWYHNDGPANLAIVTGVLLTKQALDFDKVRAVYRERLPGFARFCQRVVERGFPLATPYWEDVPNFNIDQHLHHIALAAPHTLKALRTLVSDIASEPLDHAQPLWQVHVVDDVAGGSALIMRCHHCVADGTAMMTVAHSLFDSTANAPHRPPPASASPQHDTPQEQGLAAPVISALTRMAHGVRATIGAATDMVTHPQAVAGKAMLAVGGMGMLLGELLKANDPPSPLKGEFAPQKRVAWSRPVAIKDVKRIGTRHGAKVNDVLVAAVTGALRLYLQAHDVDVDHTTLRAMVPVDLRPPERLGQLGNEFGLVILDLAITKAHSQQRLALTKARMDALKRSPEPVATKMLLDILGLAPKAVEDFANNLFGSKASVVLTNVVGPREELYLAGVPIDRMMAWAPHPGRQLGMAISIMSYRGMATLTVIGDARLVPDPEKITQEFNREFQVLLQAAKTTAAKVPRQARAM